MKPTLKPYTFAIRYSHQHKPKIAKEYVLPTLSTRPKIKYENTTKYKNNSLNSSKYEHCSPHQL